jgi:hypothetical protein
MDAPYFAPNRLLQSWTQSPSFSGTQQTVVLRGPMDAPQFSPSRIPQGWTQNLLASTLALPSAANWTDFKLPIAPTPLLQSWVQGVPIGISLAVLPPGLWDDFRLPAAWPRLPRSWLGPVSLSLSQQTVVMREPMEAPKFATRLYAWRQAWNPNNLTPQQAASPPGVRFRVIGSYIVRHFK